MFVRPRISQGEAERLLSRRRIFLPFRSNRAQGIPSKTELIYLPFYLFEVIVHRGEKKQKVTLSVDGLLGHGVLFASQELSPAQEKGRALSDFILPSPEARRIALEEYRGALLEHGLRSRSSPRAEEISDEKRIFYPFWVGYFKKRKGYDFRALDAVSGEVQGVRMRRVFLEAFRRLVQI